MFTVISSPVDIHFTLTEFVASSFSPKITTAFAPLADWASSIFLKLRPEISDWAESPFDLNSAAISGSCSAKFADCTN